MNIPSWLTEIAAAAERAQAEAPEGLRRAAVRSRTAPTLPPGYVIRDGSAGGEESHNRESSPGRQSAA